MNFRKLKEFIETIPEEMLDYEVELEFKYNTKSTTIIKSGNIEGIIFVDDLPLKLIGVEEF